MQIGAKGNDKGEIRTRAPFETTDSRREED